MIQAQDMAEIFLRQGFAFVALGHYEWAGQAMRRGLKLQRAWKPDDLRLDRLYGPEKVSKTAHLEGLAVSLQKSPHDATALYLTGMELFFDGQVAPRARSSFARPNWAPTTITCSMDLYPPRQRQRQPVQAPARPGAGAEHLQRQEREWRSDGGPRSQNRPIAAQFSIYEPSCFLGDALSSSESATARGRSLLRLPAGLLLGIQDFLGLGLSLDQDRAQLESCAARVLLLAAPGPGRPRSRLFSASG